jgi:hypothetical protein
MKNTINNIIGFLILVLIATMMSSCQKQSITQPSVVTSTTQTSNYHLTCSTSGGMVNALILNKDTIEYYMKKTPMGWFSPYMTSGDTTICVKKGDIVKSVYGIHTSSNFFITTRLNNNILQTYSLTSQGGEMFTVTDTIK